MNLVANDPQDSKILYAATFGYGSGGGFTGLFKSIDGANTWFPINTGLLDLASRALITAIVIDPDDTNIVYAGTGGYEDHRGQGVFKSIDGGKNWAAIQ